MPVNASNNKLGWKGSDFNLISVDNKHYTFDELKGVNGTIVAFICNHCPYVIQIIKQFISDANSLKEYGISTIAIMPNDVFAYPEDSFDNMKIFAKKYNFTFPYLYDSSQEIAKKYDAICTPDFYGFNSFGYLKYRGRIHQTSVKINNKNTKTELFYAMEHIIKTKEGPKTQYNSLGCSVKWIKDE